MSNMSDERFRVASTMPGINHKLKINIEDVYEKIYWYIKFNLILDKRSVTNQTMQVMDTDGYIMRTYIAYDTYRHLIVVSPMDTYLENKYYILCISTDVRSEKGQNLKKSIYILFKLINNSISKYEILKNTKSVPNPRPRPHNYDEMLRGTSELIINESSSKQQDISEKDLKENLLFASFKLDFRLIILSIFLLALGFLINFVPLFFIGATVFIFAFTLITRKAYEQRPQMFYNMGAYYFNKQKYAKADKFLQKSFDINRNNHARYGIRIIKKHLTDIQINDENK